jgi:hypothetical protein
MYAIFIQTLHSMEVLLSYWIPFFFGYPIAQIHDTALDTTSSETTRHCLWRNSIACGALCTTPLQKVPCRVIRQVEEQHLRHPSTSTALSRHTSTRNGMKTAPYITTTCDKADEQLFYKDQIVLPSHIHEPRLTEPRAFYPADEGDVLSSPFSTARRRRPAEPAAVYSVDEYDDRPSSINLSRRYYQASTSYNLLRWQRGCPPSFVEHHARAPLSSAGHRARWNRRTSAHVTTMPSCRSDCFACAIRPAIRGHVSEQQNNTCLLLSAC